MVARATEPTQSPKPRSGRRAVAPIAVILLAAAGLGLGAMKIAHERPRGGAAPLGDVGRYLFVPSREAAEVTVIDGKSDRTVTRIPLAAIPRQVLVSEAAEVMVASFPGRSVLEVIDLSFPAEKAQTIDLAIVPESLVLSPDGYLVAAAETGSGSITVVSLPKRRALLRLSGFADPGNLTFSVDGSQLYVTDGKALELAVVDIVQQSVVERTRLAEDGAANGGADRNGFGVSALTRTPDGRYGFVSVAGLDSVVVVDLSTRRPVKRLRVGHAPLRPYGTADGRLMLVPNDGDPSVSIIDTASLQVAATLPGAKDATAINTGWFESLAFVMSRQKRVVVLDLMSFRKLDDIELPAPPGAGVVTSNGQKLYTALADVDRVAVIDTQAHKLAALVEGVGRGPAGAVLARSNNYCH